MSTIQESKHTETTSANHEDEIDLIQLAKTLWNGRRTVIRTTLIFMVLGLFIAIFSAKEYTATTTMVPQSAEGGLKLGGLGGLAAMAGINLGSMGGGSDIPPSLYPKIISSIPFQKELMQTPLDIEGQKKQVTFTYFYEEIYSPGLLGNMVKYSIGLPGVIIRAIRREEETLSPDPSSLISINEDEKKLIEIIQEQLSIEFNDKDGYVTISARMPEAKAAAQLAKKAQELLQQAITAFKIQKAQDQLAFVEERYAEKEAVFNAVQDKLARFRDQNKNVSTAVAQTQLERLQSDFSMASSVYTELAKQLETQKIQVKEDTPVFTIIEPVFIPMEKSKPKRPMILVIWTFLGGIVGVGMVFGKEFFASIKDKWREDETASQELSSRSRESGEGSQQ
ncbi:exopolysaccharide biosynthesis protein [Labilibaculum sp. A4]|uniref:GNVR domain-containing protein n=1 Tax=Labilibaculum euxinus TaxID=2686357 RepID=UPI000F619E4F|nr:GNVR domain-containing protein [Labilibaculum euxinus]MDQ1772716.1 Wzz/FepE/Etk N-terminal domain-containing protein [Labilibaculum euxinus]MWN78326.1 exopolysaccharide biosynthesis protein [Labilibaculum euxinus]